MQTIKNARSVYEAVNAERKRQKLTWKQISEQCAVAFETMKGWSGRPGARLDCIVDVLDALGLELIIRRKGDGENDS